MLSVRTLVNGSLSQRLVKDTNAPYKNKKLEFTSSSIFAPTERMTLNVESLGEPTQSSDLQNNQCAIISTIQLKAGHKKDASSVYMKETRDLLDHAGDAMLELGYQLIYGPEDMSDSNNSIVVARFRRTVGAGEIDSFKLKAK